MLKPLYLTYFENFIQKSKFKNTTTIAKTIAQGDMVMVHSKTIDPTISRGLGTGVIDVRLIKKVKLLTFGILLNN